MTLKDHCQPSTDGRILVVEDDQDTAEDICLRIAGLGYKVVGHALNGVQAIELAGKHKPDLILMDILLPGELNGIEAMKRIVSERFVPVVYISAACEEWVLDSAKVTLPYGYLVKPCTSLSLKAAISMALYKAQNESRKRRVLWASSVFGSISDGVVAIDLDGLIVLVNKAGEEIVGAQAPVLEGRHWHEMFTINSASGTDLVSQSLLQVLENKIDFHSDSASYLNRADGKIFPVNFTISPVLDSMARISGAVIVIRDIREQIKSQELIKQKQEFIQAILNNVADGIVACDSRGVPTFFNQAAQHLYGISREENTMRAQSSQYHSTAGLGTREGIDPLSQVFSGQDLSNTEIELTPASGKKRVVLASGQVLFDNQGEKMGAVVSLHDITERKTNEFELQKYREHLQDLVDERTQELSALTQELEAFSYSVSHDLQAPLRSLVGFSEALIEDYGAAFDSTGRDYLTRVQRASLRMSHMIDDLLNLSLVVNAQMDCDRINLGKMAGQVMHELSDGESERELEWICQERGHVYGDRHLLQVLLVHLLGNAWKFTEPRNIARIEFGCTSQNHEDVWFVKDNGVGFDDKFSERIFHPFQRWHKEDEFAGYGIGLAIANRIVRRHGGRIWVESKVDQGTCVFFTLPLEKCDFQ